MLGSIGLVIVVGLASLLGVAALLLIPAALLARFLRRVQAPRTVVVRGVPRETRRAAAWPQAHPHP